MICNNCGTTIPDGSQTCPTCGVKVAAQNSTVQTASTAPGNVPEEKRKLCGILAIVTLVGVHSFMLGEKKKGILHILLVFPGIILFYVPFILGCVWSIIEGIKILKGTYVVDPNKWFAL